MTRFILNPANKIVIDGKDYYPFIPISKFAMIVANNKGESYIYYHFEGVKSIPNKLGSMVCQPLCGHGLKRFHLSCLRCGYRLAWLGKIPRLRKLKMIYSIYIPADLSLARMKDVLRKACLTPAELLST